MTTVTRPANGSDVVAMALAMRDADRCELVAASGREPCGVLCEALRKSSESWATLIDGELAALWGVVDVRSGALVGRAGCAWLHTTPRVERSPKAFWRACLAEIRRLLERWDMIANCIDVRHTKALRWAKRLGFVLEEARPFGPLGLPFQRFTATREGLAWALRQ